MTITPKSIAPRLHQIGGDAEPPHSQERHQHGQRNHRRNNQRRAQVAQEQEQNRHHQRSPLKQVVANRADGPVDNHRLVVERDDPHALGKRTANPVERLFDALDDRLAVLASEHDHHARDGLPLAVARDRPLPRHFPNLDLSHVTQVDRGTLVGRQDDRRQVPLALYAAQAAHGVLLGGVLDESAAEVVIVLPNPLEHVTQRQSVSVQAVRIHLDLVLPRVAAPGVDVGHARHGLQLVFDLPVVERLQLHGAVAFPFERVPIHLAEGRRHRPQGRLEAGRNSAAGFVQPFVDELPREIIVHAVGKNDGNHRKAQLGNRADFLGVGEGPSWTTRWGRLPVARPPPGAMPGASVMTVTWLLVRSGKASMGVW